MSNKDCELDMIFCPKQCLQYPGTCSLEYLSQMQILLEKLLAWDSKKKCAKQRDIIGHYIVFIAAYGEQGSYMLHMHMQLFRE